ncbi:MAG TPA: aminotransferase class V-fold PLP-dependent enzyme, partial [bacterium]|nr:aminotransferase class V-fold PLP-dependent enzyme [bacterium]
MLSERPHAQKGKKTSGDYDVEKIRTDFPVLNQKVYGKPLVYLDNGATTQKPRAVIDALNHFYSLENANIHRGIYFLSQQATHSYENVRTKVKKYLNAAEDREIV